MSDITPPPLDSGEEPNDPARKRKIRSEVAFLDPAAAALNIVNTPKLATKTGRRPNISDSGAQNTGPIENPSTYNDIPSVAPASERPNSLMTCACPPLYAELAKATVKVENAMSMVAAHLVRARKFFGFNGSLLRKVTRIGSSAVPVPIQAAIHGAVKYPTSGCGVLLDRLGMAEPRQPHP